MEDDVPNDVKEIENHLKAINYGFERIETLPEGLFDKPTINIWIFLVMTETRFYFP